MRGLNVAAPVRPRRTGGGLHMAAAKPDRLKHLPGAGSQDLIGRTVGGDGAAARLGPRAKQLLACDKAGPAVEVRREQDILD